MISYIQNIPSPKCILLFRHTNKYSARNMRRTLRSRRISSLRGYVWKENSCLFNTQKKIITRILPFWILSFTWPFSMSKACTYVASDIAKQHFQGKLMNWRNLQFAHLMNNLKITCLCQMVEGRDDDSLYITNKTDVYCVTKHFQPLILLLMIWFYYSLKCMWITSRVKINLKWKLWIIANFLSIRWVW